MLYIAGVSSNTRISLQISHLYLEVNKFLEELYKIWISNLMFSEYSSTLVCSIPSWEHVYTPFSTSVCFFPYCEHFFDIILRFIYIYIYIFEEGEVRATQQGVYLTSASSFEQSILKIQYAWIKLYTIYTYKNRYMCVCLRQA